MKGWGDEGVEKIRGVVDGHVVIHHDRIRRC